MEKSKEKYPENDILKEITPVKFTRNYDAAKSTNGKTNPLANNQGYSTQYAKRKNSRHSKMRNKAKFIAKTQTQEGFSQRSKSVSSKGGKSAQSGKSNSSNRVVDLKEVRNNVKTKKQARIGIHGTDLDKMIAHTNFSQLSKNYAVNI